MRHAKVFSYSIVATAAGNESYMTKSCNFLSLFYAGITADKDILITPVPLYHVQGGVCGVTAAIFYGIPQVILRKFSASRFWEQCIKYNATASQYLGEIIRLVFTTDIWLKN